MAGGETAEVRAGRVAERRLGALQLAALLGNVSEACRRLGIDRASYYTWRRRFRAGGIEALRPAWRRESRAAPKAEAAAARVERAALEHPGWGCARLARAIAGMGLHLSPPTVQSALRRAGIPRRRDRALRLERLARQDGAALTAEQIALVERFEPGFRDRAMTAARPGAQVLQAVFYLGRVEGRRAYLHCVVDAFSSYALARVGTGRGRAAAAGSLLVSCVDELRGRGLVPRTVLTPGAPSFSGAPDRPYGRAVRRCRVRLIHMDGLCGQLERFRHHILGELLHGNHHLHLGEPWEALGERTRACVEAYNARPLDGHPNYGVAPEARLGGFAEANGQGRRENAGCREHGLTPDSLRPRSIPPQRGSTGS